MSAENASELDNGYCVTCLPVPPSVARGCCRWCRKLNWQCRGHIVGWCDRT